MSKKIKIGALISGGGTNLQAIIDSCGSGKIDGEMVFVGSDNPEARGLERAKKHTISTFVVDYKTIIHRYKNEPDKTQLPEDFRLDEIFPDVTALLGQTTDIPNGDLEPVEKSFSFTDFSINERWAS